VNVSSIHITSIITFLSICVYSCIILSSVFIANIEILGTFKFTAFEKELKVHFKFMYLNFALI